MEYEIQYMSTARLNFCVVAILKNGFVICWHGCCGKVLFGCVHVWVCEYVR